MNQHWKQRDRFIKHLEKLCCALRSVIPSLGVHHDGVGLIDHARDEGLAVLAGDLGHLDHVPTRVGPVEVAGHPVYCNTPWHFQVCDLDFATKQKRGEVREKVGQTLTHANTQKRSSLGN